MIRNICLASILVALVSASAASAKDQRVAGLDANGNLDSLIARHAAANNVPEEMVRRIIKRESDFDTDNLKVKGVERYSFGWSDPRGYYGSSGAG